MLLRWLSLVHLYSPVVTVYAVYDKTTVSDHPVQAFDGQTMTCETIKLPGLVGIKGNAPPSNFFLNGREP